MSPLKLFFYNILDGWGSDTPPEAIWALHQLLLYSIDKGFKVTEEELVQSTYENDQNIFFNEEFIERWTTFLEGLN
jgi:hypothetical protein